MYLISHRARGAPDQRETSLSAVQTAPGMRVHAFDFAHPTHTPSLAVHTVVPQMPRALRRDRRAGTWAAVGGGGTDNGQTGGACTAATTLLEPLTRPAAPTLPPQPCSALPALTSRLHQPSSIPPFSARPFAPRSRDKEAAGGGGGGVCGGA
eukprot:2997164-Rhodomonas_salina.1